MYLAFNSKVYFHESTPPEDTNVLWIQTSPVDRVVPTSALFVDSDINIVEESKQLLSIYKFEAIPQVKIFSATSQDWEVCVGAYTLVSNDGYVLKDSNGIYLVTKKGND